MTRHVLAAATLALTLAAAGTGPANATPASSLKLLNDAAASTSMAEAVQYRSCRRVYRMCAYRWPGHGWRFRRCMRLRGC